jgi:hypothetical protein
VYAVIVCVVLKTGVPSLPPVFVGLPGAPSGIRSLKFLGTTKEQLPQDSESKSELKLDLAPKLPLPLSEPRYSPKYGL